MEGKVIPIVRYKAEIDLSDEGATKMLDAYIDDAFTPVNAVDAFAAYRIPFGKKEMALTLLGRYDYMSDHSKGNKDETGKLKTDDPERHRLTGGVTLSLGKAPLQADARLSYEQYFYGKGVTPLISEQNKIALELVAHF